MVNPKTNEDFFSKVQLESSQEDKQGLYIKHPGQLCTQKVIFVHERLKGRARGALAPTPTPTPTPLTAGLNTILSFSTFWDKNSIFLVLFKQ